MLLMLSVHFPLSFFLKISTLFYFKYVIFLIIGGTTMTIRYLNKWGIMKFKTPEKMKVSNNNNMKVICMFIPFYVYYHSNVQELE